MATTFRFVVSCPEERAAAAGRALAQAHAEVSRLEDCLTEFREPSPIHRLNQARPGERVRLTPEGIELLRRTEGFRELSRGAFDCAAKSTARPERGPAVSWDEETLEAWRLGSEVRIGFGAVGKGYALDQVRLILVQQGLQDFLLSAGGSSVILSGHAAPGDPWRWGWSWAKDGDGDDVGIPLSHPTGAPIAVGVSGTHEKGAHLLDGRRGPSTPARARALSALIAAPSAADADALSTAMYVAGYEEASQFLKDLPFAPGMAQIGTDRTPSWNGIFRHYFGDLARAGLTLAAALLLHSTQALADPAADKDVKARMDQAHEALRAAAAAVLEKPTDASDVQSGAGDKAQAISPPAPTAPSTPAQDAAPSDAAASGAGEDGSIDLGGMSANTFAPYVTERSPFWILLPLFALATVLIHLKKTRRNPVKTPAPAPQAPSQSLPLVFASILLWSTLEQAHAVDLVPMGKAIMGVLGTPKAFKKTIGDATFFYSKNAQGKADKVAFIEKNNWQGSCTHTWIVGIGPDGKVKSVVAQEQQCPHAKPSAADSFLDQYKGKGPADMAKLKGDVNTIAKATGSCDLATEAVIHAVNSYQKIKGQI